MEVRPEYIDKPLLVTTSNLPLGVGYVHVLPRDRFRHTDGFQWVSEVVVKPIVTVSVDPETHLQLGGTHRHF